MFRWTVFLLGVLFFVTTFSLGGLPAGAATFTNLIFFMLLGLLALALTLIIKTNDKSLFE